MIKTLEDIKSEGIKENTIYNCDCLEALKYIEAKSIDLVLTDPPYSDYYQEEYKYCDGILDILKNMNCRQFVFWSAKVDFPLDYTAIHIWDKWIGAGSQYERIFERNGNKEYKVFKYAAGGNDFRARIGRDINTGHPSQKPIYLIQKLLADYSRENDLILDPFLGSGTTAVAAKLLKRRFIGVEISEAYCQIARDRLRNTPDPLF